MSDKDWIQTALGYRYDLFDPSVVDFRPMEIAHALSNVCRFSGHCAEFYSVAEHSVRVSFRCEELARDRCPAFPKHSTPCEICETIIKDSARWGLLHDAAEAFIHDVNRPLKHSPLMAGYRELEARTMKLIAERFELGPEPPEVHVADNDLLLTETRDIMSPRHPDWDEPVATLKAQGSRELDHVQIACWVPSKARKIWLRRFVELFPEWQERLA